MERYICIHGHFYQPPRENPWLEAIELQDSSYPYHDWNKRITAECYATNATSRILDDKGRIVQIVNNYSKISFNFGPTLLSWLHEEAPDIYAAIIEADKESQKTFSGHGSALAQPYNHMILPLANRRDKITQVLWGIQDFERRFGRKPEGMWLPETAVDLESLDILSEQGIRFTILAPHQAQHLRPIGEKKWQDVSGAKIDPTMAYILRLPSGRSLSLFFYDGPLSQAVAFEGLLKSGESFAQRLLGAFSYEPDRPQLVHIATDGETYGHHHRFGDMALAYALNYIESENIARIINYPEYLEKHPPTHEVEIFENTSWSCPHGVERWQGDCGCSTGSHPEWNQGWRAPLRESLNRLRDRLDAAYDEKGRQLLKDPWEARNGYIELIMDRSPANIDRFLNLHATDELTEAEKITVLKLLEIQRHAMLMYTSCGWFFDELSGLETVQVMQYAGRAVQLAQEISGDNLESPFLENLKGAKSNIAEHGDGRQIYEEFIRPTMVDLEKVGAHYAVSSLFEEYEEQAKIYCYTADQEDYQISEAGRAKLVIGRARISSEITRESSGLCFGVLHWGDHNLNCAVSKALKPEAYQVFVHEAFETFTRADFPETLRLLDKHFGASAYSLMSLFRDQQRKILNLILEPMLIEAEASYRQLYEHHVPLMRFLKDSRVPQPKALYVAAEFVLNNDLRQAFEAEELDPEIIQPLLEEARIEGVSLDADAIEYTLRRGIEAMSDALQSSPDDLDILLRLEATAVLLQSLPFEVNLWKPQNIFYEILENNYPDFRDRAQRGNKPAQQWIEHFRKLGESLWVRVD
jgi:alpha-amylase/alpha-mannosidase (GH57 family)